MFHISFTNYFLIALFIIYYLLDWTNKQKNYAYYRLNFVTMKKMLVLELESSTA